ncbi:MAG: hypothetical protein E6G64_06580 [Actinobacteria bacterium]|nr:MAG: hypothetical protein E6G64_06580 [Actinomycetota bacterium]
MPGLCSGWNAFDGFRAWRFRCANALEIAAALRRVGRMRASPANWIFSAAQRIDVPAPGVLVVRLRFPWRRFPYALTVVAAAPRGVDGPFRLVRGSRNRVELTRNGITVSFRRLTGIGVLRALRRGELDEAPIPLGDAGRFRSDPATLRVRRLLAMDAVVFRRGAVPEDVRRAYWQTANRDDYQALVAEDGAAAAFGIVGKPRKDDPAAFRRAVKSIDSLPPIHVRITVPPDATLQYGSRILYAQWRDRALGPELVLPREPADADFRRVAAPYPQDEALLGAFGLPAALGTYDQRAAFARLDEGLQRSALVIPVCWVADARWVSPRLRGWSEDVLGDVDYTRVSVAG